MKTTRRKLLIHTLGAIATGTLFKKAAHAGELGGNLVGPRGAGLLENLTASSRKLVLKDNGDGRWVTEIDGMAPSSTPFPNDRCRVGLKVQRRPLFLPKSPSMSSEFFRTGRNPIPTGTGWFGVSVNAVLFYPIGPNFLEDASTNYEYNVMKPIIFHGLGLDPMWAMHPLETGEGHYHAEAPGFIACLKAGILAGGGSLNRPILAGWSADGFPIYTSDCHGNPADAASSIREMKSSYVMTGLPRPLGAPASEEDGGNADGTFCEDHAYVAGSGDLDQCSGHFGVTPEFPNGTYHYHLTKDYPYIPRYWAGTPDGSFRLVAATRGDVPPPITKKYWRKV